MKNCGRVRLANRLQPDVSIFFGVNVVNLHNRSQTFIILGLFAVVGSFAQASQTARAADYRSVSDCQAYLTGAKHHVGLVKQHLEMAFLNHPLYLSAPNPEKVLTDLDQYLGRKILTEQSSQSLYEDPAFRIHQNSSTSGLSLSISAGGPTLIASLGVPDLKPYMERTREGLYRANNGSPAAEIMTDNTLFGFWLKNSYEGAMALVAYQQTGTPYGSLMDDFMFGSARPCTQTQSTEKTLVLVDENGGTLCFNLMFSLGRGKPDAVFGRTSYIE